MMLVAIVVDYSYLNWKQVHANNCYCCLMNCYLIIIYLLMVVVVVVVSAGVADNPFQEIILVQLVLF
jgi:hypothetical protein